MSLFSSLQLANNSLTAAQIGLQVAGNNIANSNTPGYIRQEVMLTPAPLQRKGDLNLGLGVRVQGIVQKVDYFLEDRLRSANSDVANGEAQESAFGELEALMSELSDGDLSTSLNTFFSSVHDVLNQPESPAVRNLAVLQGRTLTDSIRRLDRQVRDLRENINDQIENTVPDINRLLEQIADLNVQIVTIEGGDTSQSDAVGLRDQRLMALSELSKFMNVKSVEHPTGSVSVSVGGDYVVFEGTHRKVLSRTSTGGDTSVAEIRLAETDSPLQLTSGKLVGLASARDDVLGGFLNQLDDFTRTMIYEFNKVFSGGQGQSGYRTATSEFAVENADVALDQAGLEFTPVNGSFQVLVRNPNTGLTETHDIFVNLDGLDEDTSLNDLATALDDIGGVAASVSPAGKLVLTSESQNLEFAFKDDTSGVLAALGVNTFFSGTGSRSVGVQTVVRDDPSKFAASRDGVGEDSDNAAQLANFLDTPLESQNGATLVGLYEQMAGGITQSAAMSKAVADGYRTFQRTLEGQKMAVSGVSIDEEAISMITNQRVFQASARFIATVGEMLDMLVNL